MLKKNFLLFLIIFLFSAKLHSAVSETHSETRTLKKTSLQNVAFPKAISKQGVLEKVKKENSLEQKDKVAVNYINESLDKWLLHLKKERKNINAENFPYVLESNICRPLKELKQANLPVSEEKLRAFFLEVVKVYGKVLDYSMDHNYMYCLYHYFKTPKPEEILNISKQVLNQIKHKNFLDRLNACHKEEMEGNGDGYEKIEIYQEEEKEEEEEFLENEIFYDHSIPEQSFYSNKKIIYLTKNEYLHPSDSPFLDDLNFLLILKETKNKCFIGGVFKKLFYSRSKKRYVCLPEGKRCNGADSFKCGFIFNEKCVPLYPVRSLSKRCYEAAKEELFDEREYYKYMETVHLYYEFYCSERERQGKGKGTACKYYHQRVKELNTYFSIQEQKKEEQVERQAEEQELDRTEEKACSDCDELFEDIKRLDMIDYFSDTIFENSSCKCSGNTRCTRGCKIDAVFPQIRCRGKKNKNRSLSYCMRYTNGAIMSTLHTFFGKSCPNNSFNYKLCLTSAENKKNTLCDQSFIFPSALCGLSLDGQDRYKIIRNKRVRSRCRQWLEHNRRLTTVEVLGQDGQVLKKIPLFQKIDMPKDPEDLPKGSIIVSKSDSIHGHVEIKTNRRECGVKAKDFCFCSDFCDARNGGYRWPFKPQVVFQWNPEFIHYFGNK